MPDFRFLQRRAAARRALAGGILALALAACREDAAAPSSTSPLPDDPVAADSIDPVPADSSDAAEPLGVQLDNRSSRPGIVFGSSNMENQYLNSVHTGWHQGGPLDPSNILSKLAGARAKGGRVVIKLCKGRDSFVKNSDGTFSLSKWKSLVSRYRSVNLAPYINDGTIIGHYLIDEPSRAQRWGGKAISRGTLEEMARYSKSIWPSMTTFVRAAPTWLAGTTMTYRYLDAGWAQYAYGKGEINRWISAEVAAAKQKGLGLAVGMNVLDGGNGSSGIAGWTRGKWAMSPSEIRTYGSALLGQSYSCAFFNWMHDLDYYNRTTIKQAFADVSPKARNHAKTSCRQ